MDDTERLSVLIGDIYDAALDPGLWPTVLEQTAGYVGGGCAALVMQDAVAKQAEFFQLWGLSSNERDRYLTKYIRLNPCNIATMLQTKVGDVESSGTVIPLAEFFASSFYQEWCKPVGFCDCIWTMVEKSATAAAALSVVRHERDGVADEDSRNRMRLLAPHLTSGARRKGGIAYSAVAAVFVRKAALEFPHPIESIAAAFKLTPAEMRVLMMIVEVGGVPEVAPVLGISETTVKTHLQRVFAKTGTSRQADLVKLVVGYMSPVAG